METLESYDYTDTHLKLQYIIAYHNLLVLVILVKIQYRSHSAVHSNVTSQLLSSNNIVTSKDTDLPVQHSYSLPLRHCEAPSAFASPSNI